MMQTFLRKVYNSSLACQCNSQCPKNKDCCEDYNKFCPDEFFVRKAQDSCKNKCGWPQMYHIESVQTVVDLTTITTILNMNSSEMVTTSPCIASATASVHITITAALTTHYIVKVQIW